MSTITMATPARRPMASLKGTRLKGLTSFKNAQNSLPFTTPSALKRHVPQEFDDADIENIDPLTFSTPSKKARGFDFEMKSEKTPLFTLPLKKPAQYVEHPQAAGRKRKAEDVVDTESSNGSLKHQRVIPSSAPPAAGRSPKNKKLGILSRRRMTSSPFTRINPPTFSVGESQTSQPFSIDAALAGTVPGLALKSKSGPRTRGWHFDIHEDTPDEEMANLMEHSTCTLDISDDEAGSLLKGDKDNKENIPPVDGPAAVHHSATQVTATRRDMMTDEPRTPLGDLVAQDFYAAGCDATSVILIPAEDADDNTNEKSPIVGNVTESSPSQSRANTVTEATECWKAIIAGMNTDAIAADSEAYLAPEQGASNEATTEIKIWESESAKGDDDVPTEEPHFEKATTESVLA
ncbi:hypothetical protein JMJ35_006856 [Cladonia borealis]|uniref:Thymidylate kinase n=1 Tax=Cladonia borealis TaxID=184061 RepID=A0AA39QYR0_9LECA|nr:hypothetical protein JMJ35_006856 [Cladonia borealis]